MLLYLEGMDAASMADITGISPAHVRIQIHRIKLHARVAYDYERCPKIDLSGEQETLSRQ